MARILKDKQNKPYHILPLSEKCKEFRSKNINYERYESSNEHINWDAIATKIKSYKAKLTKKFGLFWEFCHNKNFMVLDMYKPDRGPQLQKIDPIHVRQIRKSKTNKMNYKSSFSSLTSLKISNQLQDQCRPFQKIRFG